jgi:hypothetical protein
MNVFTVNFVNYAQYFDIFFLKILHELASETFTFTAKVSVNER